MEIIWRVKSWEGEGGEWGENHRDLEASLGRYKIDRGRLKTVSEMEKQKNLYAQPMDMN